MTKDEEIIELKKECRRLQKRVDDEIKVGLIKALEMQPGKKYVLFFGKNNGISLDDVARIRDPLFVDTIFVVDSVENITLSGLKEIKKMIEDHHENY